MLNAPMGGPCEQFATKQGHCALAKSGPFGLHMCVSNACQLKIHLYTRESNTNVSLTSQLYTFGFFTLTPFGSADATDPVCYALAACEASCAPRSTC